MFRKIVKEIKENFFLPGVVYHLYIKCGKKGLQAYIEKTLHKPENYGKLSIKEGKNGEGNREMGEKIQKKNQK